MTRIWREPPGEWLHERPDDIEPGLTQHLLAAYIHDLRVMVGPDEMREFVAVCVNREFGGEPTQ